MSASAPKVAPYGSWPSPITIDMLTEGNIRLSSPIVDGDDLYWIEMRPSEGGRNVLVRRRNGKIQDVSPQGFNVRTRIHEYGGTPFAVAEGIVLASSFEDQRIYRLDGAEPVPLTPKPRVAGGDRYANLVFHGDLVLAVREQHRPNAAEPVNEVVAFPVDGSSAPKVIASGHDFFSSVVRSHGGERLAWLTWDHPRMPWDGTELWVADLAADGSLGEPELIAGGATVSVFQPEWGPDGALYWVSDESGWWSLRRSGDVLDDRSLEYGVPQWLFGWRTYGFSAEGVLVAIVTDRGRKRLVRFADGEPDDLDLAGHDSFEPYLAIAGEKLWVVAGDASTPLGIVGLDLATGKVETVRRNFETPLDRSAFSEPELVEAPTTGGEVAHAFYYPPHNPECVGPDSAAPPLLVISHGGPTGATTTDLDLGIQFWTSRGIGVVDVNYRGSTGYGRAYRAALEGAWGVVDSDDCIAAARHLAETGRVDGSRMAIRGGSAGGYTTLCALAFHDVFAAGASYFGVADCSALAEHTHKFESRYLDSMIGPYPEAEDVYRARSPLHHAEGITCPVVLFQGEDDKVVPPAQAEVMVEALTRSGTPHAYLLFAGEGHGFRKAETIAAARAAELSFYAHVFGFTPADDIPRLHLT